MNNKKKVIKGFLSDTKQLIIQIIAGIVSGAVLIYFPINNESLADRIIYAITFNDPSEIYQQAQISLDCGKYEEAAHLLSLSCMRNYRIGLTDLALLYYFGLGVNQDIPKALLLLEEADNMIARWDILYITLQEDEFDDLIEKTISELLYKDNDRFTANWISRVMTGKDLIERLENDSDFSVENMTYSIEQLKNVRYRTYQYIYYITSYSESNGLESNINVAIIPCSPDEPNAFVLNTDMLFFTPRETWIPEELISSMRESSAYSPTK